MRLSRNISAYLIQGCFLALITILSPFGFYAHGHQVPSEPTRTELVEQDRFHLVATSNLSHVAIEIRELPIDFSGILAQEEIHVRELIRQACTCYSDTPFFHKKTTHSTSSEDEPISVLPFA